MASSIAPLWNRLTGATPVAAIATPPPQEQRRTRQPSAFDAGLNSSNAWTTDQKVRTSIASSGSSSAPRDDASITSTDDGVGEIASGEEDYWKDGLEEVQGRSARALYAFEGKPEFRELSVEAGDNLEVLKEEVGEGWSLVRVVDGGSRAVGATEKSEEGEVGLIPRSYYTFTADFTPSPDLEVDSSPNDVTAAFTRTASPVAVLSAYAKRKETSTSSTKTIKAASGASTGVKQQSEPVPIVPQNTGEWRNALLPNFRQSLLGGKSLNRFSSFVTSGAEEWVLKGSEAEVEEPAPRIQVTSEEGNDANGSKPQHQKESTFLSPYKMLHSRSTTETSFTDEDGPSSQSSRLGGDASKSKFLSSTGVNGKASNKRDGTSESDRHFVDVGPSWKEKVPPFKVMVHSPSKRTSTLSGAYTVYTVTSLFHPGSLKALNGSDDDDYPTYGLGKSRPRGIDGLPASDASPPTAITVQRRFSHFVILHTALTKRLPGVALPPLPEKQYAGRFSDDFVEARRGDLERYIGKIVRHPVARYAEIVTFFLSCESDIEWRKMLPKHLAIPAAGPAFYARVFHPAFNLDAEDAEEAVERFDVHTKAVSKGVQGLRNIFGQLRDARVEMSKAERLLSYSLLSLITSKSFASAPLTGITEEDEDEGDGSSDRKCKGLMNDDGAWCWRDDCKACLGMTKALQKTSETLQSVADLYDDHARRRQLATHESLKGMAHPSTLYEPIITTHRSTLKRYREAMETQSEGCSSEEMAARCETVLNTTMAEMETYHTQKVEDFTTLAKEHLDGEIEFYEQVLSRLKTARATLEPDQTAMLSKTPRVPSIYERELETPKLIPKPLLQPCPHVFDSAPMRPVSVAIQEGVNMLMSPGTTGRGSVFGKFW